MALRIATKRHVLYTATLDNPGRQQIEARAKRTHGRVIATNEQDPLDARLPDRALQEIAGLCEACEPPSGDMRYSHIAGAVQADAGRNDVVMRHAWRVIDEHRDTRIEQIA